MSTQLSANGGVPFSFFEGYFIFNCWFCALTFPPTVLAEAFGWRSFGTSALLVFLVLVNSIILLAIQFFILSRRGRIEPLSSFHFRAPAMLFAVAFLVSLVSLFVHNT